MLSNPFNMCSRHDRIPSSRLPQSGRTFFLLVLPCGPRRCLQRCQHFGASMFPPSLWRHLALYQLREAEGRYPCNGMNPVYLFFIYCFKHMKRLRFTIIHRLTLHRGAPLAPYRASIQRGGASVASRTAPAAHESKSGRTRVIPKTNLSLESGRFGLAFIKLDFIFGNPCSFLTACGANDIVLYVRVSIRAHISPYTHSFSNKSRKATDFSILSCLCLV